MLRACRRREIIRRLADDGFIEVAELARSMSVDASTIRRDLAELTRAGIVERSRGGALRARPEQAVDIPWDVKRTVQPAAKAAIARLAAGLVRDGETILLDSGSTVFGMVPWLRHRRRLTVVTNDIETAHRLARLDVRLVVLGGVLLDTVYTLVGPQTLAALAELHVDQAFLGADAIDREAGITNINVVEVAVKRAMIAAAARTTVLADSTKFDRRALARVASLDDVSAIVTDEGLRPAVRARYAGLDIRYAPAGEAVERSDAVERSQAVDRSQRA